ncbi:hypothetical protein EPO17_00255 [Patescibacteria group bacterium]|nr:MAG: hypothetical protein EPO17_00255 [Patescibacteria group bacterium]
MHPLTLQKAVSTTDLGYWGRKSTLTVEPYHLSGFYWRNGRGVSLIRPSITEFNFRRLRLSLPPHKLEVFEHILPLWFTGLTGVTISCTGAWPPYDGSVMPLWREVYPQCVPDTTRRLPRYTVSQAVFFGYNKPRNGQRAYTQILPSRDGMLTLKVSIDYRGLGKIERTIVLPDGGALEKIFAARPQGWPKSAYPLARLASLVGLPHRRNMCWPQDMRSVEATLNEFVLHRVLDLLGGLAPLCGDGLFVGEVTSHCSGHLADWHVVKKAQHLLVQV